MLAFGAALRLLQGLQGVAVVTRHLPQLPQPPAQLGHAGVQRVQTDVHLVQACVQAGQATHCVWTGRTLDRDPGGGARGPEDLGRPGPRASGAELGWGVCTQDPWKVGAGDSGLWRGKAGDPELLGV